MSQLRDHDPIEVKHLYWIAAFLDGEGYFGFSGTPVISVVSTDIDLLYKLINYTKSDIIIHSVKKRSSTHKDAYIARICAGLAIQWMMTLYSLMSKRRQEKIKEIINKWKEVQGNITGKEYCKNGHKLSGINLIIHISGYRVCRICKREYQRNRRFGRIS